MKMGAIATEGHARTWPPRHGGLREMAAQTASRRNMAVALRVEQSWSRRLMARFIRLRSELWMFEVPAG